MKNFNLLVFLIGIVLVSSCAHQSNKGNKLMEISKLDREIVLDDSAPTFSGDVVVQMLFKEHDPSTLSGADVTFKAKARSAWHTHPKGQILVVTKGEGYIQQWGEKARKIQKGDVIWTPPGVKHWHGACADKSITHTALQESVNGSPVKWMEKVSDEQYNMVVKNLK